MTAYYIAARFSRHAEMREYRAELAKYGNTVTSRWIDLHGGDQLESAAQSVLNTDPGSVAHFGANDLAAGFVECFRVLAPSGVLIFKWNEVQIPVSQILALTEQKPLIGHRSGKQSLTHWITFLKAGDPA